MSPQPSSFVGYIENYGIKLWKPFKQQYSMGRNGHRPKWSWTEMVMGRNDPEPLYNMSRDMRKQTLIYAYAKTKTQSRSASLFSLNG